MIWVYRRSYLFNEAAKRKEERLLLPLLYTDSDLFYEVSSTKNISFGSIAGSPFVDYSQHRNCWSFTRRSWCATHSGVFSLWYVWDLLPGSSCVDRLDYLWRNYELLLDNKHAGVVPRSAAVVCAGRNCDKLVWRELVDRVDRVLVRAYNHAYLI